MPATSRTSALAILAAAALTNSAVAETNRIEISNVAQGLMRRAADGTWEVYQEGDDFEVVQNGECIANGKQISCMWYGVTFDYSAKSKKTKLKCTTTTSSPIISVTPNKIDKRPSVEASGKLVLRGRAGREIRPGYVHAPWKSGSTVKERGECYHNGELVPSVEFTLRG